MNRPVDSTLGWRCAGISPWPTVTTNPSGTTPSARSTLTSRAVLHLEAQHGPAEISWSDSPKDGGKGTCTAKIAPEPGKASLTGTLTLATSGSLAAGGWVEGCGNLAFADDTGIVHMDIVATPCSVIAMRQHGALRSVIDPVAVVPIPGQDVILEFVLPDAPKAGLGIKVSAGEGGLQVDGVVDGGPAWAAGVEREGQRLDLTIVRAPIPG